MKKQLIIIYLIAVTLKCAGQENDISQQISDIAEQIADNEADPEIVSLYVEQLNELAEDPVKINSADESEIARLFFLSDFQVKTLTEHVRNSGSVVSVYEIASIPGFDRQSAEMMIPFISLSPVSSHSADSVRFLNNFLSNLIFTPGETDTASIGSAVRLLAKYRFTSGRLSGGFTTEKDPGEKLFDFLSGYLAWSGKGIVRKIIAGDFSARFGQGLNLNTGLRTGLSLTSQGYMAARNEIKPYTSTDENSFLRGLAAQFAWKRAGLAFFFSHNRIDATEIWSPDSSLTYIESLVTTGLHNTAPLILKKDRLAETSYGLNMSYDFRSLKTGFCWSESRFSLPVMPDMSDPENIYKFSGSRNGLFSVYYNSLINRILLYGEISLNDFRKYAFIQGVTIRPSDRLSVNFIYRYYAPGYTSFHGNGPGVSSEDRNEQGLLGNFTFEAAKYLFVSAGYDLCSYPWLRYRCSFPSMAGRSEIKIRYQPLGSLSFDLSYNTRHTLTDDVQERGIPAIMETRSRLLKGQVKYALSERISFLTRIDYRKVLTSGSTGVLFLQDIICSSSRIPVTVWFRYAIYNTGGWESNLYTYENDLLYSFSIPALYGKGSRSYIMVNWDIGRRAELRIKYALTTLSQLNSYKDNDEMKLQLRVWF